MKTSIKNSKSSTLSKWVARFQKISILLVLLLIIVILSILTPAFLTPNNIMLIIKQSAIIGILAVGMTFVIITGGIDISVGAIIAFSGVCSAYFSTSSYPDMPIIVPFMIAVASGALVGVINGIGIAYCKIPNMIMTMCTQMIARGFALVITKGTPIFDLNESYKKISNTFFFSITDSSGEKIFMGIPSLAVYFLIVFAAGAVLLHFTVYGRRIFSIGGNKEAARYSGLKVEKIEMSAYVICGALAGLCGILMASRITSGNGTTAEGYEMNAIASAVIGGVSLTGGRGNIFGSFIGALIIGTIANGLDVMGISAYYKQIIQGGIILMAVFFDIRSRNRKD